MRYFSTFSGIGGFEIGIQQAYERLYNGCTHTRECEAQGQLSSTGEGVISESGPVSCDCVQPSTVVFNNEGHESNTQHAPVCSEPGQEERQQGREWPADQHGVQLHDRDGSAPLCVGYSEFDKYAIKVYERHFGGHKNYGDITQINAEELPDFDCLVGGFPCQAFSIAGKRGGFEDTRGTLFFDLARILRAKQPRLFVFENVKGLLSHDNGNTFRTIIATIDELGYDCQWQVLNSKNHGVPQNRERIFIVGHIRGTSRPKVFPITAGSGQTIKYDVSGSQRDRVYNKSGIAPTIPTMQGGNTHPKIADFRYDEGLRIRKNNISPTIRSEFKSQNHSTSALLIKNFKIRRLTPVECERLQGFPDNWTALGINDELISDTQRYKMCGNAVTTNVIQSIFERILV